MLMMLMLMHRCMSMAMIVVNPPIVNVIICCREPPSVGVTVLANVTGTVTVDVAVTHTSVVDKR